MKVKIETTGQTAYNIIRTHHYAHITVEESCRIVNEWVESIREVEKEVFGEERSPFFTKDQIRNCRVYISNQ